MSDSDTKIPRDEFSSARRGLINNPGALGGITHLHLDDFYGALETWSIETYRVDGDTTTFLQHHTRERSIRLVLPPKVMDAIYRQDAQLDAKGRRRSARKAVETRRLRGDRIGNPEALAAARRARKAGKKR